MSDEIKYVGYFDDESNESESRNFALSAAMKMRYICNVLLRIGCEVEVVSPSQTRGRRGFPGKVYRTDQGFTVRLFRTFGRGGRVRGVFRLLSGQLSIFWYLIWSVRRGESVLVYHSLLLQFPVLFAKYVRGFRLLLEVEELYQDVGRLPILIKWGEHAVIRNADAYIFASDLLNERLNPAGRNNIVLYGSYAMEGDSDQPGVEFEDGRVHAVYAGTLDPRKGGIACIDAALYLDESFHIHILGVGSPAEVAQCKDRIRHLQRETTCKISYDGVLTGPALGAFLRMCHVGLATQNPEAKFNGTSFPSKIITYLAHGLRVVSVRIDAVQRSSVAEELVFSDSISGEDVAEAIRSASRIGRLPLTYLRRLDSEFVAKMVAFLEVERRS